MRSKLRVLIILIVLLFAACARAGDENGNPPSPTADPPSPQPTLTSLPPTETAIPPEPTQEPPTPIPTEDLSTLGEPFPLLPEGSEISIKQVEMLNADFGWGLAPSDDGIYHILRTDDGGETWREITPPQPLTASDFLLYPAVNFSNPETGWATYEFTDLLWTTKDGGVTWHYKQLEDIAALGGLIFSLDQDRVWYFQFMGGGMQKVYTIIYRSDDGGTQWTKLLDPYTDVAIQSFDKTGVFFIDAQHGWLTRFFRGVTSRITLETTADGGESWEILDLATPPSAMDLFTACMCGLYDPHLTSQSSGSFRLTCQCGSFESPLFKSYLYQTADGGETWDIQYIPEGELHFISPGVYYVIGREIYRTEDGGENWDFVKTVNWDGQLSFVDNLTALGIAHCTDDDEAALVKTTNGCQTFALINPILLPSLSER